MKGKVGYKGYESTVSVRVKVRVLYWQELGRFGFEGTATFCGACSGSCKGRFGAKSAFLLDLFK